MSRPMAPFFRLVLYTVIYFMFGHGGVASSVDMGETEPESEPIVGDTSTAQSPSLADFTGSSEVEGTTATNDSADSNTEKQVDDSAIVPDMASSDDELPELTRLMLAYQQNLSRTASSSSDEEREGREQPMLDTSTERGSSELSDDSRVSENVVRGRSNEDDIPDDDGDHESKTISAALFDSSSSDHVAMVNEGAAVHIEPNPRHRASNSEDGNLPVDRPAIVEQVANVNDHLHTAAEAIKETIRSEDKEAATPIPLHVQKETLESHGDLYQERNGRDPREVVAPPTLTIVDNGSGDDEDEAEAVDLKTDRMDSSGLDNEEDEDDHASLPDDDFDDRTLLDIFGESAKEYLTQRVIPDTDADCLWDWRSLRCEPSCKCSFQFKSGDYHLGRSCRRRSAALDVCEPTVFIQDKPIPKRILSLVRQSTDILKENIKGTAHKVVQSTTRQYGQLQEHVCLDLWSRLHDNPATGIRCWSSVPETTTLPEKLLCGPIEGPMCDDEPLRGTKSPFATAAAAAATRMDRRKDTIFGDLYEKEF